MLNDLVAVNNHRIMGYEQALQHPKDEYADLRPLFLQVIDDSRQAKMELGSEVENLKSDNESGTTDGRKIYLGWMNFKAIFSGHTGHEILQSLEHSEKAAQKAYQQALAKLGILNYLRELISTQKGALRACHEEIKASRDQVAHA